MDRRMFLGKNLAVSAAALALPLLGAAGARARPAGPPTVGHPSGRALRIGLVDLDTSHADGIARVISGLEKAEIAAVIDRGLVYGPERMEKFAAEYKVGKICKSIEEMIPLIDVAMVIGVDWSRHVDDAELFIRAGTPVFIDKPVVGSEADARRLLELRARHGTPVFGGSTYRYNVTFLELKEKMRDLSDKVALTVYGKINSHGRDDMLDLMYYGIHGAETAQEIMGPGAVAVRHVDFYRKQHIIHVRYDNRPPVMLVLGWALSSTRAALLTDRALENFEPSADEGFIYPLILSRMAESLVTRSEDRPISEQIEACRLLLAARRSRAEGGREVPLGELGDWDAFDGKAFALEYRRFRNLPRELQRDWRRNEI